MNNFCQQTQASLAQNRLLSSLARRFASGHRPLLLILLLHLALSLAYTSLVPLGEAPDEPAHLSYARFIARHGRLPVTLAERQAAGYRATWPPLYHFLAAGPLVGGGDTPPTRLKSVGDTPRRLIPTNGQTIAAFIHTADEVWPWRGLPLAWHLSRLISVTLTALTVITTYVIAWRLTRQRSIAIGAAGLQATLPQVLFIGSVLNDDSLLMLLSGLVLLTLVVYTQRATPPGPGQLFLLGALLGLATVAKYNAFPLWILTLIWTASLLHQTFPIRPLAYLCPVEYSPIRPPVPGRVFAHSSIRLLALLAGAIVTGGWWFVFIWFHFNQVDRLGLFPGSLAALTAGTADASLHQLTAGGSSVAFPPVTAWLEWFTTLFQSFWGLFGGGSTIEWPGWIYWLLAVICLLAIGSGIGRQVAGGRVAGSRVAGNKVAGSKATRNTQHATRNTQHATRNTQHATILLFLSPFFFLPLPLLRFILTGGSHITETAQGRHLFPALPAIALLLVWGLSRFTSLARLLLTARQVHAPRSPLSALRSSLPAPRSPLSVLRSPLSLLHPTIILPTFTFLLSLYSLNLIQASYPPPIPLWTTADAATADTLVEVTLNESMTLVGYELEPAPEGMLPLTLVWQARAIPAEDYLIDLSLTGPNGQPLGGWVGHPLGGRYPTRAWDKGDILRHTLLIPLLPALPATEASLTLRLLDSALQPTGQPSTLTTNLSLPPAALSPLPPDQLRADDLPPEAPFTYRSTLSFSLPDRTTPPGLITPNGQTFAPTTFLPGPAGSIAHFIVAANWPSGDYQLVISNYQVTIGVENRPRQFEPPPMADTVNANFADHVTLLGYDLPQRRVQPGESFPLTLHWRAERTMGQNLTVFNHLLDQEAIQRGGADRTPLKHYTTLLWVPGEVVSDPYQVPVEASAPPGVYWLDVGLYPSDQPNFSLPLFVDGQPIDRTSVRLGPFKVGGPPPGLTLTEVHPQHSLKQTFGDQITLLGFNLTEATGKPILPGDKVENRKSKIVNLKLFWQANTGPSADYTVFVHLLDAQGNLVTQADSPPAAGAYPTSLWDPGEIIVDEHTINDLAPGQYTLQVGLYRPDTGERLPVEGIAEGAVRLVGFEVE